MEEREINAFCPLWWHKLIFWKKWVYPAVFDEVLYGKTAKKEEYPHKKSKSHGVLRIKLISKKLIRTHKKAGKKIKNLGFIEF